MNYAKNAMSHPTLVCRIRINGSALRKLRPMLLYSIWKVLSRRWSADNKFFTFLMGVSSEN